MADQRSGLTRAESGLPSPHTVEATGSDRAGGSAGDGHQPRPCLRRRPTDSRRRRLDHHRSPGHGRGLGRRRHGLHLRGQDRRPRGMLGRQPLGTGHPASRRGRVRRRQRRRDPLVRRPCRRAPGLLGRRRRGKAIAAGQVHRGWRGGNNTCALRTNGTLTCFGADTFGQSSPPLTGPSSRSAPAPTSPARSPRRARRSRCWGRDDLDQASPPPGRYVALSVGKDTPARSPRTPPSPAGEETRAAGRAGAAASFAR